MRTVFSRLSSLHRKALTFSAEVERHPVRPFDVLYVDGASGGEGYGVEAVGLKGCGQLLRLPPVANGTLSAAPTETRIALR